MKLPRRQFLLWSPALPRCRVSRLAWSQSYPARPVRLIVQVPAGSAPDIIARVMANWLTQRLGQQFVVDNRPGASGNLATEAVIRAPADGYSLLLAMSANAINASLYEKLHFNFARDAAPVASIVREPLGLEINRRFRDFPSIAYAKANPGKINVASTGNGALASRRGGAVQDDGRRQPRSRRLPRRAVAIPDLISGQLWHLNAG